jgi:hypothetical protein
VSQDAHTTTLSGGLPNYGAAFENVDDVNAAEVPFSPASDIYLEDLINDLDDVYQVSTQRLIIYRWHLLTCTPGFLRSLVHLNAA